MSHRTNWILLTVAVLFTAIAFLVPGRQSASARKMAPAADPTPEKSLFSEYRGVKIGMAATEVRSKLGKARDETDAQDQYIFSDNESALVYYDASKNVNAIMITFQGDVSKAPVAKDVFGEDVAPNPQGMIFRMEKYPKAGYWISYTRTTGTDAMVNIALQKM
jgi:hypothetical protein